MDDASYGKMDVNSGNQRWSRWTFGVRASESKLPSLNNCVDNARRFFAKGFQTTVGRVHCKRTGVDYEFIVEVEGPPAHDSAYAENVRQEFSKNFVNKGFGSSAYMTKFEVGILAGSKENGEPPEQLLVMPRILTESQLFMGQG